MKHLILIPMLVATLGLAACDRPTVVNVPATPAPVAIPGPAGPQGATGAQGSPGAEGEKGAVGKPGEGTTVIVTPPAPEPAPAPKY